MAIKRPNLAALAEAAGSVRGKPHIAAVNAGDKPDQWEAQGPRSQVPPSRAGQKPITAFFPEPVRIQLKMMAAEQRRSMESMIGEALNDLFAKHGKPEIAVLDDAR